MIEHGQISNLIASNREYFSLGENDRVFQLSSLSYDSSVEEIFMAGVLVHRSSWVLIA